VGDRNGDNPEFRIALCGYEGEHAMPDTWECVAVESARRLQPDGAREREPRAERIWFSPHCLKADLPLFA
jgi:DNA adenine methylase